MHFQSVRLPNELLGGHFPATEGQHGYAIRPSIWLVPPTLPPSPGASEGIGPRIDSLGCWSW